MGGGASQLKCLETGPCDEQVTIERDADPLVDRGRDFRT
jgi:hypothetical protein